MAYTIPTTQELYEAHVARLEARLGQNAPISDRAFIRVLAACESALDIGHYKYAADAVLQNIALTATGTGLDRIGNDNATPRKLAETAVITATIPATAGTIIPANWEFVGDANGVRYKNDAAVTAIAPGTAFLTLRCAESGDAGNLDIADTLSISAQIAGAQTQATVTGTTQTGVDDETDADYRPRVLFAQRAITGGSNATDHKIWAEAVVGVRRAFPYSGSPGFATSYPGERTVYVESVTTIDADGLAPASLIADVREAINTDPLTGKSRMILGLTDATLYVQSITRQPYFVEISNLLSAPAITAAIKSDIDIALDLYFRTIAPFIDGVDVPQERNDAITSISVADIVQDVLFSYGATADTITFGILPGISIPYSLLNPGVLAKLGSVTYV